MVKRKIASRVQDVEQEGASFQFIPGFEKSDDVTNKRERREHIAKKVTIARTCMGCAFGFLLFFVGVVVLTGLVLAKTGLMDVPFLSNYFYTRPMPTRTVRVTGDSVRSAQDALEKKVEDVLSRTDGTGPSGSREPIPVTISFTEQELTALVQAFIRENPDVPVQNVQIVITPQEIEIFCEIGGGSSSRDSAIVIGGRPLVSENMLFVEWTKIKIGELSLPAQAGNAFLGNVLRSHLDEINRYITAQGALRTIQLGDGVVEIEGALFSP